MGRRGFRVRRRGLRIEREVYGYFYVRKVVEKEIVKIIEKEDFSKVERRIIRGKKGIISIV